MIASLKKKNNRFFEGSTEQNKLLFSHTNGLLCVTNVEMKQQQKTKNDCQKKQTMVDQENENFLGPRKWKLSWTKKMKTFLDQENENFLGPRKKENNFTNKKMKTML